MSVQVTPVTLVVTCFKASTSKSSRWILDSDTENKRFLILEIWKGHSRIPPPYNHFFKVGTMRSSDQGLNAWHEMPHHPWHCTITSDLAMRKPSMVYSNNRASSWMCRSHPPRNELEWATRMKIRFGPEQPKHGKQTDWPGIPGHHILDTDKRIPCYSQATAIRSLVFRVWTAFPRFHPLLLVQVKSNKPLVKGAAHKCTGVVLTRRSHWKLSVYIWNWIWGSVYV